MNFDWLEYLNLAEELAGRSGSSSNQEAKLRSAISRAYYAAFIKARNYLRDTEGIKVPFDRDIHLFVQNQFKHHPDKNRQKIGQWLGILRVTRNKADYDDKVKRLPRITQRILTMAAEVIASLDKL
jgi:hypothetical protein